MSRSYGVSVRWVAISRQLSSDVGGIDDEVVNPFLARQKGTWLG